MTEQQPAVRSVAFQSVLIGFAIWWTTHLVFAVFDIGRPDDSELEHVDAVVTGRAFGWQGRHDGDASEIEYSFSDASGTQRVGSTSLHLAPGESVRVAYLRADPDLNFALEAIETGRRRRLSMLLLAGAVAGWLMWKARARAVLPTSRPTSPRAAANIRATILGATLGAASLSVVPPSSWPLPHLGAAIDALVLSTLLASGALAATLRRFAPSSICLLAACWCALSLAGGQDLIADLGTRRGLFTLVFVLGCAAAVNAFGAPRVP